MTDAEIAYAAGFFDGEGSISIIRHGPCSYRVVLQTPQISRTVLDWLAIRWDGRVTERRPKTHNSSLQWSWRLNQHHAAKFLQDVRPLLKVKHRQAWLALEFLAQATFYPSMPPTTEEMALREGFRLAMRYLNRRRGLDNPLYSKKRS